MPRDGVAGTPSALEDQESVTVAPAAYAAEPLPEAWTAEALETIEFQAVLDLVAGYAAGPEGAARVRARRPTDDVRWIRDELARVGEVIALFRRGDALLAEAVPDLARPLARLRLEGSILEGPELLGIRQALAAARRVELDLRRVAELAPRAAALRAPLPEKTLERRLEQAIDDEGGVMDTASPALAAARREVQAARQRLLKRLEGILRGLDASAATGGTVTVRGDRYVIPVRRDSRSRPAGIIHDESASQGTLFVEPSEAVELGNALREAEVAEERETLRVLRELTELLRPAHAEIRAAVEMVVAVDDLVARGRYAAAVDGEVPGVAAAPAPFVVVTGRHPLLLAQGEPVVPFDLTLTEGERTLLVSGPNTGGKTVLLKASALAAALAQSGVVPPVAAGTRLPVFRRWFADIGDRQSIAASLSTFSAHVAMLRRILDAADDATLVLLDEVGSGTDPAEGAALAAATLVTLTRRHAVTLATTHLGALKDLASHERGVVNGSLQFDAATLTPTYRFVKGVPGRSYGLAIARRLGVPADVLAEAEARVPDAEKSLDALLARVEERQQALERETAAAAERTLELEGLQARLALQQEAQAAREAELARREKAAEREARAQAKQYLMDARREVEQALGLARQAADDAAAKAARRRIEEGVQAESAAISRLDAAAAREQQGGGGAIEPGQRVKARGLTGTVLEVRDGKLVVMAGSMRLTVDAKEAVVVGGGGVAKRKEERARAESASAVDGVSHEAVFEIDLRGMTGDEAEAATLAALDGATLAEQPFLRIIHGKGTGALRERVRHVVANDRRVAKYEFAPANQGGVGVTVVEFR
ncbi:MAG TPA: Smr/MutS family protein [Gemmatimonadales bacterium]|nr:Smr/MutS family protein [Gemmatimonadales bacterium]